MKYYDTSYTEFDLDKSITDEYGVKYSVDGKRLLKGCELEDYTIKEGTEIICDKAFQSMSFCKITLPKSIKALGKLCFANNKKLNNINLPCNLEYIETNNPFGGCFLLKHINIESKEFLLKDNLLYSSDFHKLFCALYNFEENAEILIDERTIEISANCFWNHKNISKVIIPPSVTYIGNAAFKYSEIESIVVKGDIKVIPEDFANCSSGKYLELPESVRVIEKNAFYMSHYEDIKIGSSIEEIKESAFENAIGIHTIKFDNLKQMDKCAFSICPRLETVIINGTIKEIPIQAFQCCQSLSHVELGESITILRDNAFYKNEQLISVIIKGKIEEIEVGNFIDCDNLSEISVTKENYFSTLYSIIKYTPRLEGIIYDGFYNCKKENPLYTASLEVNNAYIGCRALSLNEISNNMLPFWKKFSREIKNQKWFKKTDNRNYSVTGFAAFNTSRAINREKKNVICNYTICALNDLGLGYYFYSDYYIHHECSVLILQTLLINGKYLSDIIKECLVYLDIEETNKNEIEFMGYIIEFLISKTTHFDEENEEIRFYYEENPSIESKMILHYRNRFIHELLSYSPDFFNRHDHKDKFEIFYPTLMKFIRIHVSNISEEDYNDIIVDKNTYIRNII